MRQFSIQKHITNLMLKLKFLALEAKNAKTTTLTILDVNMVVVGIKELIKILRYVKQIKTGYIVYIYIKNPHLAYYGKQLLLKLKFKKNIRILKSIKALNTYSSFLRSKKKQFFKIIIALDIFDKKILDESIRNNLFIMYLISLKKNQLINGVYTMYNMISNSHKLIVIFAIIKQILKKRKLKFNTKNEKSSKI